MPSIQLQFFTPKPWLKPDMGGKLRVGLRNTLVDVVLANGGTLGFSFTEAYFKDCVSFDLRKAYEEENIEEVNRLLSLQNTDDVRAQVIFTQKDKEQVIPGDQEVRDKIKDALNEFLLEFDGFMPEITRSSWVVPMYGASFGVAKKPN